MNDAAKPKRRLIDHWWGRVLISIPMIAAVGLALHQIVPSSLLRRVLDSLILLSLLTFAFSRQRVRRLIDHWWVQLLVALWIIAILTNYFRLQFGRVLAMAGLLPEH